MSKDNGIRILLIGKTGSGKSETGNTILGCNGDKFKTSPNPKSVTKKCQCEISYRFEKKIEVVDTPGVFDHNESTDKTKKDIHDIMEDMKLGPHAILVCVPMTRFDKTDLDTLEFYSQIFGDDLKSYVVIVFTHLDEWQKKLKLRRQDNLESKKQEFIEQLPGEYRTYTSTNRYIMLDNFGNPDERTDKVQSLIETINKLNAGKYFTNDMFKENEKKLQRDKQIKTVTEYAKAAVPLLSAVGLGYVYASAPAVGSSTEAVKTMFRSTSSLLVTTGSFVASATFQSAVSYFKR